MDSATPDLSAEVGGDWRQGVKARASIERESPIRATCDWRGLMRTSSGYGASPFRQIQAP
jgi:hypothetical protein